MRDRIGLSKNEKKLLARMGLDPYQARVIENIWKKKYDMLRTYRWTNALFYVSALMGNIQLLFILVYGTDYPNALACTVAFELVLFNIYLVFEVYSCTSVIRSSDSNLILNEHGIILTYMGSFEKRTKQGLAILFVSLGILNCMYFSLYSAVTIGVLSALFVDISWRLIGTVGKARTKIENELETIGING